MRPKTCEVHDCPMSENPPHKIALLHIAATVSTTTNTTGILVQNGWVAYLHSCQAFRQRGDAAKGNRRRFAARDGVRFACKNKVVNSFCMPLRALNVSKTRRKNCYWILLGITCWHLVMLEFTCRFWRVQFFFFLLHMYCTWLHRPASAQICRICFCQCTGVAWVVTWNWFECTPAKTSWVPNFG